MSHAVAVAEPVEISERIEEIAALVHSGEVRAAVRLTRKVLDAADTATFETPHGYAAGIPYVVVNGEIVVKNGSQTTVRPGQVLANTAVDNKR